MKDTCTLYTCTLFITFIIIKKASKRIVSSFAILYKLGKACEEATSSWKDPILWSGFADKPQNWYVKLISITNYYLIMRHLQKSRGCVKFLMHSSLYKLKDHCVQFFFFIISHACVKPYLYVCLVRRKSEKKSMKKYLGLRNWKFQTTAFHFHIFTNIILFLVFQFSVTLRANGVKYI